VGRDLLTGCAIGTLLAVLDKSNDILPLLFGYATRLPTARGIETLAGAAPTLDFIWACVLDGVVVAVFLVLGYVLLRLTLRRTGLAVSAAVILLAIVQAQNLSPDTVLWVAVLEEAIIVAAAATIVMRFGLLVTAVALVLVNLLANVPLTFALSHWTATTSNLVIAAVLGLTLFGFYASRAGQPLFGSFEPKT
jgi:hypothetical protein